MKVLLDSSILFQEFLGRHPEYDSESGQGQRQLFRNRLHQAMDALSQDQEASVFCSSFHLLKLQNQLQQKQVDTKLILEEMIWQASNLNILDFKDNHWRAALNSYARLVSEADCPDFEQIVLEEIALSENCSHLFLLDPRYQAIHSDKISMLRLSDLIASSTQN
jgi:predicted nucleic acid-binding protein